MSYEYDAIIVGSGPNGFSAGITLAQAGLSVLIIEAKNSLGGGMRSAELTLPGFLHDVCSAIHPLGIGSPFFQSLPLEKHGLTWVQPTIPLAHPLLNGSSVLLDRSVKATAKGLGIDEEAYFRLIHPLVENWNELCPDLMAPLHFPKHPFLVTSFGIKGLLSAKGLSDRIFSTEKAKALIAGLAAHAMLPLDQWLTSAYGIILAVLGHVVGWPIPQGGSQNIVNALNSYYHLLGGHSVTNYPIKELRQIPSSKVVLFDISPSQILEIMGNELPTHYQLKLLKYRYGPGVFKIDWALNSPIPWTAFGCDQAGTIHLGGYFKEIAFSESEVNNSHCPDKPFVLIAQPSLFDSSRAPEGKHIAWGYCHVPSNSAFDMTERIESQLELFAPGFKDCVIARHTMSAPQMASYNWNYIGGDVNGGLSNLSQFFSRPGSWFRPYYLRKKGFYICSSSSPPGGGVHGMCGYHAAKAALRDCF